MNCEESQTLLSTYIDGELSSDERVQLEVHLDVCTECLAELAELRRLAAGYQKLPSPKPPQHLWARIDASLAEPKVGSAMSIMTRIIMIHLPTTLHSSAPMFCWPSNGLHRNTQVARSRRMRRSSWWAIVLPTWNCHPPISPMIRFTCLTCLVANVSKRFGHGMTVLAF